MSINLSDISSTDRKIRLKTYTNIFNYLNSENKLNLLINGLNDDYDTIRSNIIEFLASIYEKNNERFDLLDIFITQLQKEKFWAVKYLILKKILKYNFNNLKEYKSVLLPYLADFKPQVRLACAEVLNTLNVSEQYDIAENLIKCWRTEKDIEIRSRLTGILTESKNFVIKKELDSYNKKLAEKEKKQKEIAGMFEGI